MRIFKDKWTAWIVCGLVTLSCLFYGLDLELFHDGKNEFIWFLRTISFMPIEILLVTLLIQKIIDEREKQSKMKKLNMVIGLFFSEFGREYLSEILLVDEGASKKRGCLKMSLDWSDGDFDRAIHLMDSEHPPLQVDRGFFIQLKETLSTKREFMVKLLENPALLEHESFSELLTYIFHLIEELDMRKDLSAICDKDLAHLELDLRRSYGKLLTEWLRYLKHQKKEYPYLYSFSVRTNPFEGEPHVEFRP